MLEITVQNLRTRNSTFIKLFSTLSPTAPLGFHAASFLLLLRGPRWPSSSTGPLNVGISRLGSGSFSFSTLTPYVHRPPAGFFSISALWTFLRPTEPPCWSAVPTGLTAKQTSPVESSLIRLSSALHSECLTSPLTVPSSLSLLAVFPYSIVRKDFTAWPILPSKTQDKVQDSAHVFLP